MEPQGGRPKSEWPKAEKSGEVRFQRDLSNNKRVSVSTWNHEVRVDIRTGEDNFRFPNKKGLSLTLPRWKTLVSYEDELNKAMQEVQCHQLDHKVQYHLGGGQFVTVNPDFMGLDLRQYFILGETNKKVHPTRKGIMLNEMEWGGLKLCVSDIEKCVPELASTQMCCERADHYFHLETLKCKECNPFITLEKPQQY